MKIPTLTSLRPEALSSWTRNVALLLILFYPALTAKAADGDLDTSFDPGAGAGGVVQATAVQPDGKIVLGGGFATYDGVSRLRLARVNPDGTLDPSFDPGTGGGSDSSRTISEIVLQPDGKILIAGS